MKRLEGCKIYILFIEPLLYNNNILNNRLMSKSEELFSQMKALFEEFETEHNGKSKAAKTRARKAIGELKKLVTEYRKASVEENR